MDFDRKLWIIVFLSFDCELSPPAGGGGGGLAVTYDLAASGKEICQSFENHIASMHKTRITRGNRKTFRRHFCSGFLSIR